MHIITRKKIVDFAKNYPECATALNAWYKIVKHANFRNFAELRNVFPATDQVKGLTVFNIGGNKVRLIAAVHYNTQRLYIRHVLTHKEYDKNKWRKN